MYSICAECGSQVLDLALHMKIHNLCELEAELIEDASPFISYLRSIRSLHELCTSRDLQDQNLILFDFAVNFEYLFENFNLNMTLKVHIILHHYQDYFDMTQKSMRFTNGEFVESMHYSNKNEKIKKIIGVAHFQKAGHDPS